MKVYRRISILYCMFKHCTWTIVNNLIYDLWANTLTFIKSMVAESDTRYITALHLVVPCSEDWNENNCVCNRDELHKKIMVSMDTNKEQTYISEQMLSWNPSFYGNLTLHCYLLFTFHHQLSRKTTLRKGGKADIILTASNKYVGITWDATASLFFFKAIQHTDVCSH